MIMDNRKNFYSALTKARKEIQDVRKELGENAEKGRKEIDEKLKDINKEINDFHKSNKSDMQKQFADSNKVITAVTQELEKIKGTNEQVLNFYKSNENTRENFKQSKARGIHRRNSAGKSVSKCIASRTVSNKYGLVAEK